MIIGCYFRTETLPDALAELENLGGDVRPSHFGSSERPRPTDRIADRIRYTKFLATNSAGYFLFAPRCRFEVVARFRSGYSTIFVDPDPNSGFNDDDAIRLLRGMYGAGAELAFAADAAEYHHRNRYQAKFGINSIEAWVGRDLGRYLPGLYWATCLRGKLADRITRDDRPTAVALEATGEGVCVRVQAPSSDWTAWAPVVDAFCAAHDDIFSLDRIRPMLSAARSYLELLDLLRNWH